jgi:hypothetical protein
MVRSPRLLLVGVALVAAVLAAYGALPFALGWNDGSRLATVESLVDYRTISIDRSVFVHPSLVSPGGGTPYGPVPIPEGTADKIYVNGRYYSDKAPVPAVVMAITYAVAQRLTGLVARERVARFCYVMTLLSSGASYVATVVLLLAIAIRVLGGVGPALILTCSAALGTVALVYSRAVNIHIVLLAVVSGTVALWQRLTAGTHHSNADHLWLGALGGAAYTCDFGVGPHLLAVSICLALAAQRRLAGALLVAAGAAPLVILHHVLNYHIGGTIGPVSAVPAYFQWPGSPFEPSELTGAWRHDGIRAMVRYSAALLLGPRGFLVYNPTLVLLIPGAVLLFARRLPEWRTLVACYAFMALTWVTYGAMSTNFAGRAVSIRWFVPWLAPAYFALAVLLRECPKLWGAFVGLSAIGVTIALVTYQRGPWEFEHLAPTAWLAAATLGIASLVLAARFQTSFRHPVTSRIL